MRLPRSGPSQTPSRTTSSSGQRSEQSQSWRGLKANGKAPEASAACVACSGPIPGTPPGSARMSCASPTSRLELSGAETILGCPPGSTSNRHGITKRWVRARRPATVRSSGRSRVTVKPTETAHPGLNRTRWGPKISARSRSKARSSGAAVSSASAGVNLDRSSGSRSSRPTGAHNSWKRLVSGSSSRVSVRSSQYMAAAISALTAPADAPVTAARSVARSEARR